VHHELATHTDRSLETKHQIIARFVGSVHAVLSNGLLTNLGRRIPACNTWCRPESAPLVVNSLHNSNSYTIHAQIDTRTLLHMSWMQDDLRNEAVRRRDSSRLRTRPVAGRGEYARALLPRGCDDALSVQRDLGDNPDHPLIDWNDEITSWI
jgi:hypothetical protein